VEHQLPGQYSCTKYAGCIALQPDINFSSAQTIYFPPMAYFCSPLYLARPDPFFRLPLLAYGDLYMLRTIVFILLSLDFYGTNLAFGQGADSLLVDADLSNCIQYALKHQPLANQSAIDEKIADREIKTKLADWLPQINLNANYQNNFILQQTQFGPNVINIGTYNSSYAQFGLTQTIFDRDVLLARTSAKDVRTEFSQLTTNTKIIIVSAVSKAFYDVLLSKKQIELIDEDIILLERSLKDAYNQYKGGLVDKTDYQRATISLNNARAQKKISEELLKSKYATLKQLMSYPQEHSISLRSDSLRMANEVLSIDTLKQVLPENRIEYQLLETQKKLLQANLRYYKWGFLPSLSAVAQYNFNWFNNDFVKLYAYNFPNAYAGLNLSFPIFQGTKRTQQIRMAQLQLSRLEYDFVAMKDSIYAQYTEALSSYKSNLNNYFIQRENLSLAKEVYDVIHLQYQAGIKTYLDVIAANNDLFQAQINFVNAAFQVLINKVDVQRALGALEY
jgi:outer membrane protein TolC